MRVQLTLSTPTTRWNCTYSKDLTWNLLKFSKIYLLIADHSFQIFSQRYRLYFWVLTVTLNALFVFVSVFYTFVWLLNLCTILGSLVMQLTGQNNGGIESSAFLLAWKCNWLARTCIMNMRNATCVGTQTSKVPTRMTLLSIFYSVTVYKVMSFNIRSPLMKTLHGPECRNVRSWM